jgi:hypothetical protein
MSATAYIPVEPREHSPECRRGQDPAGPHYGLDRERCERCRALWARLDEAQMRREGRKRGLRVEPATGSIGFAVVDGTQTVALVDNLAGWRRFVDALDAGASMAEAADAVEVEP